MSTQKNSKIFERKAANVCYCIFYNICCFCRKMTKTHSLWINLSVNQLTVTAFELHLIQFELELIY